MIVDSQPIVREGIKRILSGAGIEVRSEGADVEQAISALKSASCDAIFLELSLPGPTGFQALKNIKALYPRIPVLIFTAFPEEDYGLPALRAGAAGYLCKSCSPEMMVAAVRQVVRGGR